MTTRRLFFAILLASVLLVPAGLFLVDRALTVYPTPETQTQFLRTYAPSRVFDRFRDSQYPGSTVSGGGHGAGLGFATHTQGLEQELVIRSSDSTALMAALDEDVTSFLTASGAKVISQTGNDADGIRVHYVAGKSVGSVTIKPPDPIPNPGQYLRRSLGPGEIDVWVRIGIEETWFRSGRPISASKQSLLSRLLI